jgi:hypothetical protein
VFATALPHDYSEGQMLAPLGAQSFTPSARAFARRLRASSGSEEPCVRVTFRMLLTVSTLAKKVDALARGGKPACPASP